MFAPASGTFPSAYAGAFFIADYARDCIWTMRAGPGGVPDPATLQNFGEQSPTPVDLEFGLDGDLYYVDIAGNDPQGDLHGESHEQPASRRSPRATRPAAPCR